MQHTIPFSAPEKTASIQTSSRFRVRTIRWPGNARLESLTVVEHSPQAIGDDAVVELLLSATGGSPLGVRSPFNPAECVIGDNKELLMKFSDAVQDAQLTVATLG